MIRFHPAAKREMIESARFYEEREEGLGLDFLDEVEAYVARIEENPHLGGAVTGDLRRRYLRRFPFFLIYSTTPELVLLLAVAHTSRKPGYWEDR